jgi:hypothetical protein
VCKAICLVEDPNHEGQLSNVGFFTKYFFRILGFQIEIKKMFNLVSVLTFLRRCCLQVKNLDCITNIINNWPDDSHLNYKPNANLKNYLKVEVGLVKDNYELVEEVKYFEELHDY